MDSTEEILYCRQRSISPSRSTTPVPGLSQALGSKLRPSYRHALILSLVEMSTGISRDDQSPRKKPKIEGIPVHHSPRSSLWVVPKAEAMFLVKTTGSRLRHRLPVPEESLLPICLETLERAEAMDLSEEEAEDMIYSHPGHLRRWLKTPHVSQPSTSGTTGNNSLLSVSVNYGSDLDSDYDDEFDEHVQVAPMCEAFDREIPTDEELPEPMRSDVHRVEMAMDEEIEQVVGSRASFHWEENFDSFQGTREVFTGPTPGPIKDYDTAYDAFVDIWDNNIMGHIASETNRYAKQTIDRKTVKGELEQQSRLRRWVETDMDEMYVLFALHMLMGIVMKTSLYEYWENNSWCSTERFRKLMSYSRYILLNRFYHFVDNTNICSSDSRQNEQIGPGKLRKLLPVIDHLNHKFSTLYNLHPDICLDESLTLFKGRLSWIQAIRSKAARFGMKSFEVCESHTGYLYKFKIYLGKDSEPSSETIATDLGGKSALIVLHLIEGLENLGHLLTMGNYYNSPALARHLKSKRFDCLGTLRSNRKNVPEALKKFPKNAPVSKMDWRHSGDVCTVAWKDISKVVYVLSTYHDNHTFVGTKAGTPLVKPNCIGNYTRVMGGVDLRNQKLSQYLHERKRGMKWYLKIFMRLLNVSIHNAYIMLVTSLKRRNLPFMTHRDFRKDLANQLIARHRKVSILIDLPDIRLRGDIVHEPNYLSGRINRKRCKVCYRMGVTKLVHTKCETCQVYLCFESCWREWHSLKVLNEKKHQIRLRPLI